MNNLDYKEKGQKYLFNTFAREDIAMVKGEGAKIWDADGKEYLDFLAGIAVNALGHCHPNITNALTQAANQLIHCSNYYWIPDQVRLAEILVENSPLDKVFVANSGAEANEGAMKLARKYSLEKYGKDRIQIITMKNSFHGRTVATLTATGQDSMHKGFDPLLPGHVYAEYNNIEDLKSKINDNTCGIMLELIQGEGGVIEAKQEYVDEVVKICKEKDLVLIVDEVQTGIGRCGSLFVFQQYNIVPDIVTLAKGIGGGAPIGAFMATDSLAKTFNPGDHGTTFGGNPLVTKSAVATLETILYENILDNVNEIHQYFVEKLTGLKKDFSQIVEIRGKGLLIGMEMKDPAKNIYKECLKNGLIINCTQGNVLRFAPPLNITKQDVDKCMEILEISMKNILG